ncbi:CRISPR-associated protein Csn2 [Enterococcus sp. PF1-24]|uniref:type II-A CRISPR-associated protein Csn2 n=1 Tax=unclassified Enterococcus TaxID=2608891 RepID=UPI0024732301|nr:MULTISPECIES: type II-A CRISPR-associated protein Csn2 [unclassified Enterococcus]MDH6365212.1 CRISPR-associated protein Csn2 [Enterococcus sp. PFB1-1]MDH6402313.1 CRISPR-associated protein Csn2 [Enterococcus sp. PF1-24]
MIQINFPHLDQPIELVKGKCNVLVVENNPIYSKVIYSIYNHQDEYFKIFDENNKLLKAKEIVTIFHPLAFDFNEKSIKTLFYNRIINQINMEVEEKQSLENNFRSLVNQLVELVDENNNLDVAYNDDLDFKNFFKSIDLSINQTIQSSIFEKIQLIINILDELAAEKLLIFTNLNIFLSNQEYLYMMEQINLNNQTVLIIESSRYTLENIPYYYLDTDFFLDESMVKLD